MTHNNQHSKVYKSIFDKSNNKSQYDQVMEDKDQIFMVTGLSPIPEESLQKYFPNISRIKPPPSIHELPLRELAQKKKQKMNIDTQKGYNYNIDSQINLLEYGLNQLSNSKKLEVQNMQFLYNLPENKLLAKSKSPDLFTRQSNSNKKSQQKFESYPLAADQFCDDKASSLPPLKKKAPTLGGSSKNPSSLFPPLEKKQKSALSNISIPKENPQKTPTSKKSLNYSTLSQVYSDNVFIKKLITSKKIEYQEELDVIESFNNKLIKTYISMINGDDDIFFLEYNFPFIFGELASLAAGTEHHAPEQTTKNLAVSNSISKQKRYNYDEILANTFRDKRIIIDSTTEKQSEIISKYVESNKDRSSGGIVNQQKINIPKMSEDDFELSLYSSHYNSSKFCFYQLCVKGTNNVETHIGFSEVLFVDEFHKTIEIKKFYVSKIFRKLQLFPKIIIRFIKHITMQHQNERFIIKLFARNEKFVHLLLQLQFRLSVTHQQKLTNTLKQTLILRTQDFYTKYFPSGNNS